MKLDIWFVLLCISLIFIIGLGSYLLRMREKKQIHYVFLSVIMSIFIWSFGTLLAALNNFTNMLFVNFYFIGVCFVPVTVTLLGLVFAYTKINFNWKYKLLLIFPIIDYIIIITNKYHNLFFVKYSPINTLMVYGKFYFIHTIVLYAYLLVGLGYLLYFSVKNSGFFSKQSLLIILGVCIPFILNILEITHILILPIYITPVSFAFAIMCFAFAIFKFDFLNVVPIALQRIVDLMSDSYIVINESYEIIDYNKTFVDTFKEVFKIKRKDNLLELLKEYSEYIIDISMLEELNAQAIKLKKTSIIEKRMTYQSFDKYFRIEVIPIFEKDDYIGTIILLKDITEHKKNIETIQKNQQILMEQERLASLGQMIGGIAHNLKTPIMSVAGGFEAVLDLVNEYDDSIEDKEVTVEDHHEIAKEMREWIGKMRPHLTYMSEIINTVKDQAVHMSSSNTRSFTIKELIKRVEILLNHEIKRHYCQLNMNTQVDNNLEVSGEINNIIQVIDNLIINAIHAYGANGGNIDFTIAQKNDNIEFIIKDYASGMDDEIKNKLFKQMITTKGKDGTGLGLYMSFSTIRGRFGGDMWFESEKGKGTTFYITIPIKRSIKEE